MDGINIEGASISDLFERFIEATTMKNVITIHKKILDFADLKPCEFNTFFPKYKRAITSNRQKRNWKAKALFSKIEKRANHKCYANTKAPVTAKASDNSTENCVDGSLSSQSSNRIYTNSSSNNNNNALQTYKCLIIGSGPAGLRTAIELQLLGSDRVLIVEKRSRFSRNNVLHLWPFVIDDLKSLGAKKFYGKFCAGSIDHISIRQLQLILLKVCLMIGCDFRDSCSYIGLCPSSIKQDINMVNGGISDISDNVVCKFHRNGSDLSSVSQSQLEVSDESKRDSNHESLPDQKSRQLFQTEQKLVGALGGASAHFEIEPKNQEKELHSIEWDIIIGADGRRNTLRNFFPRKEFRGRLAIAITANFINRQTTAETSVPEISGLSFIYNQDMFNALAYDTNIELENICYYKDDTHYFVMTAKKKSLLERGVLIKDYATTQDLLSDKNVSKEALLKYAKDAAYWTTGLEPLDFALNHYGQEDCAMFDFTSMYAASNACKALRTKQGGLTLVSLVGDSLLEPFWPTGSGCARGFLSSFDAAWMCRQWAINKCAVFDHHNPSRTSRNGNANGLQKSNQSELTTYDKMALSVIAERESIYRILAQTTSENLHQNYSLWTLNPHTRYPNLNRHLILPSQVEHLIADDATRQSLVVTSIEEQRRVKSTIKSRRSPKKLKSAVSSPQAQPKSVKNKITMSSKLNFKSKSQDISFDDYYLKLEESYKDLADDERGGFRQYLSYKRHDSGSSDDLFIPSLSGTLPSSHNLSRLEARKARDIDECLRHRRQKTKMTHVRDQLISQMRGESQKGDREAVGLFSGGNAAIFNEIKRMREQQSRGVRAESKPRDGASGPLSLLNSMRRCASFAERVKSFESKLSNSIQNSSESNVGTPKTPIDNVRNLPQFATLQELFVNNTSKSDERPKKTHIPIAKLTKDDWNVKCWENRLSCKQKQLSTSTRSLNKSASVDSAQINRLTKPKKQIDIFQERINEMANKLKVTEETKNVSSFTNKIEATTKNQRGPSVRAQGWVNHLKRELAKGSEFNKRSVNGQPMNPVEPNKPIRKLFEDEDDDDGIDVNKHYDHLCINRPTNKYLSKGSYTSHLARNNVKSKIINRPNPTSESKQAYLAALTSRGSSASSTLSDYSTNNGHSSSGSGGQQVSARTTSIISVECFRCRKFVSSADRITIGTSLLHRTCLTCADCKITLRSNEIQHYMNVVRDARANKRVASAEEEVKFSCVICNPEIRVALARETHGQLVEKLHDTERQQSDGNGQGFEVPTQQQRLMSREAFLSSSINYSELYKNILNSEPQELVAASAETPESINYSEVTLILPSDSARVTPSPVNQEVASQDNENRSESRRTSMELEMIDEEELQRILHLDRHQKSRESSGDSGSSTDSSKAEDGTASDEDNDDGDANGTGSRDASEESSRTEKSSNQQHRNASDQLKNGSNQAASSDDESSSLDPPSDSDDYDDEYDEEEKQDNVDLNSTCDDFVTTEEFGDQEVDDADDDATLSQASGCKSAASGTQGSDVRRPVAGSQAI